jgi:hypothetical protein
MARKALRQEELDPRGLFPEAPLAGSFSETALAQAGKISRDGGDCMFTGRRVWSGLVEIRRLPHSDLLSDSAGAFTWVVTWASNTVEFRSQADRFADSLGLYVFGVEGEHPVADEAPRTINDEIADLIERAEQNPNAILYGTFHKYRSDGG